MLSEQDKKDADKMADDLAKKCGKRTALQLINAFLSLCPESEEIKMVTKKHYKAIAEIINYQVRYNANADPNEDGSLMVCEDIAKELADYFAEDNPNFNRKKFLKACGLED